MLHMKRKLSYFQPSSPSLFSINIFHQFHFPSVHSFIHSSIHPSNHPHIHLFTQLSLLELHLSAHCIYIYFNCKITSSKNKIQVKHHQKYFVQAPSWSHFSHTRYLTLSSENNWYVFLPCLDHIASTCIAVYCFSQSMVIKFVGQN